MHSGEMHVARSSALLEIGLFSASSNPEIFDAYLEITIQSLRAQVKNSYNICRSDDKVVRSDMHKEGKTKQACTIKLDNLSLLVFLS